MYNAISPQAFTKAFKKNKFVACFKHNIVTLFLLPN